MVWGIIDLNRDLKYDIVVSKETFGMKEEGLDRENAPGQRHYGTTQLKEGRLYNLYM